MNVFAKSSHKSLTCQSKCAFQPNQAVLITVIHIGPSEDSVSAITVWVTQSEWTQATLIVAAEMELNGCLMVRISVRLVRHQHRMNMLNCATLTTVATYNLE